MQAPIIKNLLHEELSLKLKKLAEEAKVRFVKMNLFPASGWEDQSWVYQGKDKVYFFDNSASNDELSILNKVFVVAYLWDLRARSKPLGSTRIRNLAASVKLLAKVNVAGLADINQHTYDQAINYIKDNYAVGGTLCNSLNMLVRYLKASHLLSEPINLVRSSTHFRPTDEYGNVAVERKLPMPELIRAIIHLKWAIDDQWDGSVRAQLDMLSILTQAFQYGLGLRIGEVLRLPKDCLVEINGHLFCRVWTEKGSEPIARYIPKVWRPVLQEAVERINSICECFRAQAKIIESGTIVEWIDGRFQKRVEAIEDELKMAIDKLADLSAANVAIAKKRLALLKPLADEELIELKRLKEYLPLSSTANDASSLVKFYKSFGLTIISKSIGSVKNKHFVCGKDVKRRISELVEFRSNLITCDELFEFIHGRSIKASRIKSSFIKKFAQSRTMNLIEWFAVSGLKSHPGRGCVCLRYGDAIKALTNIICGGYDYQRFLPLFDAEQLYPELFNQKSMTRINSGASGGFSSYLKLSGERTAFYRRAVTSKNLNYTSGSGYLLEYDSIKNAIAKSFVTLNTKIQAEHLEEIKNEILSEGIDISSKSFSINQKVSDYLFVVPSSLGGVYNEHIPCILGYNAVLYSIKPSKNNHDVDSAFTRYGVSVKTDIINSFQTHMGRHWQTNSLFRAGLAASIVNKWMGRSDTQGDNYDHQTARERASKVAELMLSEQSRFIGELPDKIKSWREIEIPIHELEAHLNLSLQAAHYSPLGFCIRDINLKPCEYHLKCLTGNNGLGCREFVFDLYDPAQRQNIAVERDKAENELARLFEVLNRPDVPVESVEMHIKHQMTIYRNATSILERSKLILTSTQAEEVQDFQPFRTEGSKPDDCAFQCGGGQ